MPSSDFYWSRNAVKGFDMWFLIVPQKASSDGGGTNFLGSVVRAIAMVNFSPVAVV
jgi:hypothetical protein